MAYNDRSGSGAGRGGYKGGYKGGQGGGYKGRGEGGYQGKSQGDGGYRGKSQGDGQGGEGYKGSYRGNAQGGQGGGYQGKGQGGYRGNGQGGGYQGGYRGNDPQNRKPGYEGAGEAPESRGGYRGQGGYKGNGQGSGYQGGYRGNAQGGEGGGYRGKGQEGGQGKGQGGYRGNGYQSGPAQTHGKPYPSTDAGEAPRRGGYRYRANFTETPEAREGGYRRNDRQDYQRDDRRNDKRGYTPDYQRTDAPSRVQEPAPTYPTAEAGEASRPEGSRPEGSRPDGSRPEGRYKSAYNPRRIQEPAPTYPTAEAGETSRPEGPDGLVMGRNPVKEALKSGRSIERILVQKDPDGSLRELVGMARDQNVQVREVERAKLDELCMPFGHGDKTGNHQGIVALTAGVQYCEISDILAVAKEKGEPPFVLLLDGVEDPYNLGSILRSAECAGAHGVIIPKRRAVGVTAAACKASAGASEYVKVAQVSNLCGAMERLKDAGLWIYGADMSGGPMTKADLKGPVGLVIGGEGKGLSHLVKEKCDMLLSIPLRGHISSLNASVAAAVLLYEKVRQSAPAE